MLGKGLLPAFLLVLTFANLCSARKVLRHRSDPNSYDFLYLVRQWPGTFCSHHACPLLKDRDRPRFTIHGLWPNRDDGTWPQFCDRGETPYDSEAIDDLRSELDEIWPSYMDTADSDTFWAHEWNKHGTCAVTELGDEHGFFKSVLDLNEKYDLEIALENAGITPSKSRSYDKADVIAAIRDAYDVDVLVHCQNDGELTEVWMCFDKSLQPIDCDTPSSDASRCKSVIIGPIPEAHQDAIQLDAQRIVNAVDCDDKTANEVEAASQPAVQADQLVSGVVQANIEHEDDVAVSTDEGEAAVAVQNDEDDDEDDDDDDDDDEEKDDDDDDDDDEDDDEDKDDDEEKDDDDDDDDDDGQKEDEKDQDHDHDSDHDHDHGGDNDVEDENETNELLKDAGTAVTEQTTGEDVASTQITTSSLPSQKYTAAKRPTHQPPSQLARTLSIAAAGAVLVGVIAVTIASSWARRVTRSRIERTVSNDYSGFSCCTPANYPADMPAITADSQHMQAGDDLKQPLLQV